MTLNFNFDMFLSKFSTLLLFHYQFSTIYYLLLLFIEKLLLIKKRKEELKFKIYLNFFRFNKLKLDPSNMISKQRYLNLCAVLFNLDIQN